MRKRDHSNSRNPPASQKYVLIRNSVPYILKKLAFLLKNKKLQTNKGTQDSDILAKLIKDNPRLFADFIFTNLNESVAQLAFLTFQKLANITLVNKKD